MSHPAPGGSPSRSVHRDSIEPADSLEVRASDGTAVAITSRARPPRFDPAFTRRQSEILTMVGEGMSNAEIANALSISRRTVEKHLEAIHMKAGTGTRARLVAFARIHARMDSP